MGNDILTFCVILIAYIIGNVIWRLFIKEGKWAYTIYSTVILFVAGILLCIF